MPVHQHTSDPVPVFRGESDYRHFVKHVMKGCLGKVAGITKREEYMARSQAVVATAHFIFTAEKENAQDRGWYDSSAFYVDKVLLTAITSLDRKFVHTCYHEHFRNPGRWCERLRNMRVEDRLLTWKQMFEDARDTVYRNVKAIKGI